VTNEGGTVPETPDSSQLFGATRRPPRDLRTLALLTALVVSYFGLGIGAAVSFSEGERGFAWAFVGGNVVALVILSSLAPRAAGIGKRCGHCGRRRFVPRSWLVPGYLPEDLDYGLIPTCRACRGRTLDETQARVFEHLLRADELDKFLRLLERNEVTVPRTSDLVEMRAWILAFFDLLRGELGSQSRPDG
jgi:hypothetical protein